MKNEVEKTMARSVSKKKNYCKYCIAILLIIMGREELLMLI